MSDKKRRVVVKVVADEERAARWREASERDPRLVSHTGGRFSALARLELDAAADRILSDSAA